jgi:hypothetical protein
MLDDGVVGVDGTTGEVRWSRRRSGAAAEHLDVSPDGRSVLVRMSPDNRFPYQLEALDAMTGEPRFVVDNPNTWGTPGSGR